MTMRLTTSWWLATGAALTFAVTLGAQSLQKLPDELKLAKSADSPGQVVFNHSTHVDAARPDCTSCHPRPFRILKSSTAPREPITHERMDKGQQCGACHDGKKAFALADDCTMCHQAE
jgi:c(7)-type cytochrome triheme protein